MSFSFSQTTEDKSKDQDNTTKDNTTQDNTTKENKAAEKEAKNNADKLVPPQQEGAKTPNPTPYRQEDFPDWAYYTYRFAAVAVGSIPFSILLSTVSYDGYKTYIKSDELGSFQGQYLPLYISGPDKPAYESYEVVNILYITAALSVSVGMIDLIIQLIKKRQGNTINSLLR